MRYVWKLFWHCMLRRHESRIHIITALTFSVSTKCTKVHLTFFPLPIFNLHHLSPVFLCLSRPYQSWIVGWRSLRLRWFAARCWRLWTTSTAWRLFTETWRRETSSSCWTGTSNWVRFTVVSYKNHLFDDVCSAAGRGIRNERCVHIFLHILHIAQLEIVDPTQWSAWFVLSFPEKGKDRVFTVFYVKSVVEQLIFSVLFFFSGFAYVMFNFLYSVWLFVILPQSWPINLKHWANGALFHSCVEFLIFITSSLCFSCYLSHFSELLCSLCPTCISGLSLFLLICILPWVTTVRHNHWELPL